MIAPSAPLAGRSADRLLTFRPVGAAGSFGGRAGSERRTRLASRRWAASPPAQAARFRASRPGEVSGGTSLKSPPAALSYMSTEIVSPTAIFILGGWVSLLKRSAKLSRG